MIQQAVDKVKLIKERLLAAQSQQKSYADNQRRDFEFQIGDWVFVKVSPMRGVMRFGKKGKLSPRYIGLYQIVRRTGKVPMSWIYHLIWRRYIQSSMYRCYVNVLVILLEYSL